MANEEQLRLLKEGGVYAWNEWRNANQQITINLKEADLKGADLAWADLTRANLSSANLSSADLSRANLSKANLNQANLCNASLSKAILNKTRLVKAQLVNAHLSGADLCEAELTQANISGADFIEANLYRAYLLQAELVGGFFYKANLYQANLSQAILIGTDLSYANLDSAFMGFTTISDCDLRNVQGLEAITHHSPSSIGIDTIYRSKGEIPHIFLRGCGVPDNFIEYMASLTGQAFEFHSVFISFSDQNKAIAERIHADLQSKGVRCWFAPHDMKTGDHIRPAIHEAIRLHEKVLLILSEEAINSDWVEDEVEAAIDKEKDSGQGVLFPIRIDDAVMDSKAGWAASMRRKRHIGDFRQWKDHDAYQVAFNRLLKDLRSTKAAT